MKVHNRLSLLCLAAVWLVLATPPCQAKKAARVPLSPPASERAGPQVARLKIGYLLQSRSPITFPYFDPPPRDGGIQGARLGVADDNTTGTFTGQAFDLGERVIAESEDPVPEFRRMVADGYRHILIEVAAETVARLASLPEARQTLIYDVATTDDPLRGAHCSPNVLHLLPNRAMRADALAQYLAKKRWHRWFIVVGPSERDHRYGEALQRAAKRFGAKIAAQKIWTHEFTERRTPEAEIPVFTQGVDYDVLVVADEEGEFGDLLAYRSWSPRPVVGTQGLVPTAWHRTHEAWGALQLQKRFHEQANRWMKEVDYGAWLAVRSIGEAATRTKSLEFEVLRDFLLGEQFALAGFKGVPLSFRTWDRQLRQPVLLAQERSLVAVAPIEGFIHPKNELDTLGYDESESDCRFER